MALDTGETMQVTITRAQQRFADWAVDVLVYIVVLNLFVEFFDAVIIESFWISILTAVLLVALLDAVVGLEHRISSYFDEKGGTFFKVLGAATTIFILIISKLAILEIVNFVFQDKVHLGSFLDVLFLIIAMMAARAIVQKIYVGLGTGEAPKAGDDSGTS